MVGTCCMHARVGVDEQGKSPLLTAAARSVFVISELLYQLVVCSYGVDDDTHLIC